MQSRAFFIVFALLALFSLTSATLSSSSSSSTGGSNSQNATGGAAAGSSSVASFSSSSSASYPAGTYAVSFGINVNNPPAGPYFTNSSFVTNLTNDICGNIAVEINSTGTAVCQSGAIVITNLNGTAVSSAPSRRLLTASPNFSVSFVIIPVSGQSVSIVPSTAADDFVAAAAAGNLTSSTPGVTVPAQTVATPQLVGAVSSSSGVSQPNSAAHQQSTAVIALAAAAFTALLF